MTAKVHTVKKRYDSKTMSMKTVVVETGETLSADDAPTAEATADKTTAAEKPAEKAKSKPSKNAAKRIRKLVGKKNDE